MDFDLDDLILSDAANNAKVNTKFQPKAKLKPKPKPKAQPEPKSSATPSTQSVEERPTGDINQISRNVYDDWQPSFEKSQEENAESFLTLEFTGFVPESTTATVNSLPCSEAPNLHVSMDANLEKEPTEHDLESLAKVDPLTGEEAAIYNDDEHFQIGILSSEPLDVLSQSRTCSGLKVGKFKPKPKAQTRKVEQIATIPNQDELSVQYGENIHTVSSQIDYTDNGPDPWFTPDEILDSSSIRGSDSVPTETIYDFHVNEEPVSFPEVSQLDSTIPAEHLDSVPEIPSQSPESAKKGKRQSAEQNLENQALRSSERLRTRSNRTLGLIDEAENEDINDDCVHGNEDNNNNNGNYGPENESLSERKGSKTKTKKPVKEKEKPVRKRKKASEVPVESTKIVKKKFSHSTRRNRRQVNPELLKIPEDELEFHMHDVPMKELIRLAEHRERIAKKEASTSGTPVMNQSASNFSNHYDEDEAFTQGTGSAFENNYSMEAENATYYNYRTHMKTTPRMKWTKQDTELFYEAVQQFGTDLSMIRECFPGRTREQIKSKYKKEERQHPLRLNDALTTRLKGHSHFEVVIERLKQAQAQESENDDPINLTGEDDDVAVTTDNNDSADPSKAVEPEKEFKDMEPDVLPVGSPAKSHDSEDDLFRWSQYKSEI